MLCSSSIVTLVLLQAVSALYYRTKDTFSVDGNVIILRNFDVVINLDTSSIKYMYIFNYSITEDASSIIRT